MLVGRTEERAERKETRVVDFGMTIINFWMLVIECRVE
jgi:hypothetical protein